MKTTIKGNVADVVTQPGPGGTVLLTIVRESDIVGVRLTPDQWGALMAGGAAAFESRGARLDVEIVAA